MTQSPLWAAGLGWVGAAVANPDRIVSGDQGRIDDGEGLAALDEVDRRHAQDFRNSPAGTFSGPGDAAVPGAGCGKAVERAV